MRVAVGIPWRRQESRQDAMSAVLGWYAAHTDWRIDILDTEDEPFNLAACRNAIVRKVEADGGDVIILNDADTIPQLGPLREAVEWCDDGRVHLPYTEYRSLRHDGSRQFYSRKFPLEECNHFVVPGAISGVFVTTPQAWWATNGQDEHFRGWGCEDAAWHVAHKTLLGEPVRHEGAVYSLHHESAVKQGPHYDANFQRVYRYLQAEGDVEAIRALINEPVKE